MNKRWIGVLCLALCFVILPMFGRLNNQNIAVADTVYSTSDINITSYSNTLQDITISNTNIYVSDNSQKLINVFNLTTHTTSTLNNIGSSTSPCYLTFDYADNLVYSDSELDQICIYNSQDVYDTFVLGESELKISRVYDIAQSTNNDIFALVSRHSNYYLIKKAANQAKFMQVCDLPVLEENCKLAINLTGDKILLLNDDVIYSLSSTGYEVLSDYSYPALTGIISLKFDHRNNLFILCNNGTMVRSQTTEYSTITIADASGIKDFCLSPTDNTIYFMKANKVTALANAISGESAFLNAISSAPSINIMTDSLNAPSNVIKTKQDTYIYAYDNLLSKTKAISQNTLLNVLDDSDTTFYYVLDTSEQYNILGYVLKSCTEVSQTTTPSATYKTLYSNTAIYPFPTTLKNSSISDVRTLVNLPKDAVITTTACLTAPTDHNGASFVFVTTVVNNATYSGYIDSRYLTKSNDENSINQIFVSNATTRTEISVYEDDQCSNITATLAQGTEVQILSTTNGISFIEWQQDNVCHYGYAQYKNLDDGSITTSQAIGFLLMLVAIVACLITLSVINRNSIRRKMFYE